MIQIKNKKILINALSSVLQVVITGLIYFFLYKYLLSTLGAEQLGVWSLVLATSSIANLANFGITSGLVKFVAQYKATDRNNELSVLVSTSFITICIFFIILISVLFLAASFILKKVVDPNYLSIAQEILPFSLFSLFINGISGVFTSVLEGTQKNYIRNLIFSLAIIVFFILTLLFVPIYGLIGVAFAQVIQSVLIFVSAVIFSFKYFYHPNSKLIFWQKDIFKEIMTYGLKFQVVSICQMLYEPTTKALLSMYGGLVMVGFYEMASRLVTQLRAVIINANQVILPVVTEASVKKSITSVKDIYLKTLLLSVGISISLFIFIIILSPLISLVWIGKLENSFILFLILLSIANLCNIFSGPAYFGFMAEGILNPLIFVHVLIAILNMVLGYTFGYFFQGYGVALAWCLSLSIPSLILIKIYNQYISIKIKEIYKKASNILFSSFLFLIIFIIFFFNFRNYFTTNEVLFSTILLGTIYLLVALTFLLKFDIIKNNIQKNYTKKL